MNLHGLKEIEIMGTMKNQLCVTSIQSGSMKQIQFLVIPNEQPLKVMS